MANVCTANNKCLQVKGYGHMILVATIDYKSRALYEKCKAEKKPMQIY